MATNPKTIAYLLDQTSRIGVSAKPMFGEYGLYHDGRMVGLVCDDQLFIKPTPGGRAIVGDTAEAPPYPGAKPCLLIDPDRWDDPDWLADVIRVASAEIPSPKPKKAKR